MNICCFVVLLLVANYVGRVLYANNVGQLLYVVFAPPAVSAPPRLTDLKNRFQCR